MKQTLALILSIFLCALMSCGRKDVDRNGNIRLRGERKISIQGKSHGDLLQKGIASWYGKKFHGRQTSNGETYNMHSHTAAHKTLPFNTRVRVQNMENGLSTYVRINDRGPFVRGRIIDLSYAAAKDIKLDINGIAHVALFLIQDNKNFPEAIDIQTSRDQDNWTIQIGSFSQFHRARNLVSRFEDCGHRVRIEKIGNNYRVRIGSFETRAEAEKAALKLNIGHTGYWVLKDRD